MRNPKDVAVSLYHLHRSHQILGYYQGTWDVFFECLISGEVIYGSWFDHTLGWMSHIQEGEDNVLILLYDEMNKDLATHVCRLGEFLGKDLSAQAVAAIAGHCSFQSMRTNPFTSKERNPMMDFTIATFLRKGIVSDWRNQFTVAQNRRFNALWARKMENTELVQRLSM